MNKKTLTALMIVMLLKLDGSAQSIEPERMVKDFFKTYKSGDKVKAVENLYEHNEWINENASTIDKVKLTLATFTDEYVGKFEGYDLLCEKMVNDRVMVFSYLAYHNRQPFRFVFKFYKPDAHWTIYAFSVNDGVFSELERSCSVEYLEIENAVREAEH